MIEDKSKYQREYAKQTRISVKKLKKIKDLIQEVKDTGNTEGFASRLEYIVYKEEA
mgnify:CR=1 FL=1